MRKGSNGRLAKKKEVFCLLDMLKFWQKGPLMLLLSVNLGTLEVFGDVWA